MPRPLTRTSIVKRLIRQYHLRYEAPGHDIYNSWLKDNALSKGIVAARETDATVPLRIERYLATRNIDFLAGDPNKGEIPLIQSSFWEIRKTVFSTIKEADSLLLPRISSAPDSPIAAALLMIGSPRPPSNPQARPTGGIITNGIVIKTTERRGGPAFILLRGRTQAEDIRITLDIYHFDKIPGQIQICITADKLMLRIPNGRIFDTIDSNHPEGLAVATLFQYLPFIHTLCGHILKKVPPRGILFIGEARRPLLNYANQEVRIEFEYGEFKIKAADGRIIDNFEYPYPAQPVRLGRKITMAELDTYSGELDRKTGKSGDFRIGKRTIYLGAHYAQQKITVLMENGEIIRIWDIAGNEIDLAELHLTPVYNGSGEIIHIVPAQFHLTKDHFKGITGWIKVKVEEPERTSRCHIIGQEHPLKKGYQSIYAKVINGVVTQIMYFKDPQGAPWTHKSNNATIYKQVHENGNPKGELADSFAQLKSRILARVRQNKGRITHWKIGPDGSITINQKNLYIDYKMKGKHLILDFDGDTVTYHVYDRPRTTHGENFLKQGSFNIETGARIS